MRKQASSFRSRPNPVFSTPLANLTLSFLPSCAAVLTFLPDFRQISLVSQSRDQL